MSRRRSLPSGNETLTPIEAGRLALEPKMGGVDHHRGPSVLEPLVQLKAENSKGKLKPEKEAVAARTTPAVCHSTRAQDRNECWSGKSSRGKTMLEKNAPARRT